MEGKAFLDIAVKLAQMRVEPALRSAVSRAYYSAYISCIQFLRELGFRFDPSAPAHDKVYHYLNNCGVAEIESAARALNKLRKHRNEADYDMASSKFMSALECQWDIAHAQSIISQIEKCHKDPLRTQLADGLRVYQAKLHF